MRESLKFIVTEVNRLLTRNYNIIYFNALSPEELLQVLKEVIIKLQDESIQNAETANETPEQTAIYVLSILRILNYQPEVDPITFRQGLIHGDTETIHPILTWLFSHADVVRKRVYLSRFLVKVDVPVEYLGDPEVAAMHEQYTALIDRFKDSHREREAGKKNVESANELTADLQTMEKEKEAVTIRIEKMRSKANSGKHLRDAARALRLEKEKERDLALQREQETESLARLQVALQRAERELEILRKDGKQVTPQALLQQLSESVTVQKIVLKEKLPSELSAKRNRTGALAAVGQHAYFGPDQITALRARLDSLAKEIQELVERKISKDTIDKLEPFRQQAAAVANLKRNALERLEDAIAIKRELEARLDDRREHSRLAAEESAPKGEELKKYVSRLKTKSTLYKHCKAELAGLTAENSVLQRTALILENKLNQCNQERKIIEPLKKEALENFTEENGYSLNLQLSRKISSLRAKLVPLMTDVQSLREKSRVSEGNLKMASKSHSAVESSMNNEIGSLIGEISELKAKLDQSTREKEELGKATNKMKLFEERMKYDTDGSTIADPGLKMKEELRTAVQMTESSIKSLSLKKSAAIENAVKNEKQSQLWSCIVSVFEAKLKSAEESRQFDGVLLRRGGAETLVLQ